MTAFSGRRALIALGALLMALGVQGGIVAAQPLDQKPTPHQIAGREACLGCHGTGGVKPVAATHTGRTNETCVMCHLVAATPAPGTSATATPAPTGPNDACLSCHANKQLSMTFGDGKQGSVYVDGAQVTASVHGAKGIRCTDCHSSISSYPHPKQQAKDARDYSLAAYEICQRCHPGNFAQSQDSIHAQVLRTSNRFAPVCTDCHGAHDVAKAATPRTRITNTCARCHEPIYSVYSKSVHGQALVNEQNADVPTCVDCHGVHQIEDPRTAAFRLESPETCARCHTDAKLMAKYNISTDVYSTYSEDFHGVTVDFYRTKWTTIWCYKAVCTDCHGIHEILKTSDAASSVNGKNLINTCRKCHPDAPPNFTSAWTGHLQPSLERVAPVYYVQLFYQLIIPLTVGAMVLYVGLDLTRTVLDRRQAATARSARTTKTKGGRGE